MEHSESVHFAHLNDLCRACGRLVLTTKQKKAYKKPYVCDELSADVLLVFGLDTKTDDDSHSKYICVKCYTTLQTIKKRHSATSLQTARTSCEFSKNIWTKYDKDKTVEDCKSCRHRLNHRKGSAIIKHLFKQERMDASTTTVESETSTDHTESVVSGGDTTRCTNMC
ncbi:hypothetical protein PoB_003175400 [Plakobranchus ocellatus]|uniref:ZAD domain-containing protein n=1 Tax=Plakobranchus ocellatus TaxID=259542 RepID=A0AAV4AG66_9GAST|nr:hypothetical protein PoB_003175400 [Plakobranchus ocellatus]